MLFIFCFAVNNQTALPLFKKKNRSEKAVEGFNCCLLWESLGT